MAKIDCSCPDCPNGTPSEYIVIFSGVQNNPANPGACDTCADLGTVVFSSKTDDCEWLAFPDACPESSMLLSIARTDCKVRAEINTVVLSDCQVGGTFYSSDDIGDCLASTIPLTKQFAGDVDPDCAQCSNWPEIAILKAVPPTDLDAVSSEDVNCFQKQSRFCATNYNIPVLATPADGGLELGCVPCCDDGGISALGGGGGCSTSGCSYSINPANGNLRLVLSTPDAGRTGVKDSMVFNSLLEGAFGFGFGVQSILGKGIVTHTTPWEEPSCDALVKDCDGSEYWFLNRQDDGTYAVNANGAAFAFKRTGTGWLESHPLPGPKFKYDTAGLLLTIQNMSGQVWTVVRDPDTYILDPFGRRTTYTFSGGNLTGITDVFGRTTQYSIDVNGNLVQRTTPELCITSLQYDNTGSPAKLEALIEPDLSRTTFLYDDVNVPLWCTGFIKPTGSRYTYSYVNWLNTTIKDPAGFITTIVHDISRRLAGVVNPAGVRTSYVWSRGLTTSMISVATGAITNYLYTITQDNLPLLQSVSAPTGTTSYEYDAGALKAIVGPFGYRTTYMRGATGLLSTIVDPLGYHTTYTYDGQSRRETTMNALGYVTTFAYDSSGLVQTQKDPLGNVTTYTYVNGQVVTITNPLGLKIQTVYDEVNRVLARIDPLGNRTTFSYDLGGRVKTVMNPLGFVTTNTYVQGQLQQVMDANGATTVYGYDPRGNRQTVQDALGHVTTTVYDEANRHSATISPLGYITTTTYDSAGRVWSTMSPSGARTTIGYDASGRATLTIDPLGYRTTTVYDALNRVQQTIDPLGNVSSTVYDPVGRVWATVDALNSKTTTVYDGVGQTIAVINPLSYRTTTGYDPAGRAVTHTNALGFVTTTVYDKAGRAEQTIDAEGNVWSTVYDNASRVIATVDPLGHRSTTGYDRAGRTTLTIDARGNHTTYTYDAVGRQRTVQNPRGYTTTTSYDLVGRTREVTDPLGNVTTYSYDQAGNPTGITNALGHITTSAYGPVGVISRQNPLGYITTYGYDRADRLNTVMNPLEYVTTTAYDPLGRPEATINALSYATTTVYDKVGRQIASVDANAKRTTTTYDAASQPTARMNAQGYITTSVYDPAGRNTTLVNAFSYQTTYSYDKVGRRTEVIDPLGRITTASYDPAGRQNLRHDPRDYVTTYTYDEAGNLTRRLYPDDSRHTFTFDQNGNRSTMVDPTGLYSYTYDELDRPREVTNAFNKTITYAYDAVGQRATMIEPEGGVFTYSFDGAGQLDIIEQPWGESIDYDYDAIGRRIEGLFSNGTRYTIAYDQADRMIGTLNSGGNFNYTLDPVGNVLGYSGIGQSFHRATYTYDDINQLLGEEVSLAGTSGPSVSYAATHTYDRIGSRLSKDHTGAGGTTLFTYTYDAAGQITSETRNGVAVGYLYDAAGNCISGYGAGYTWDYENQMLSGDSTNVYNADFRRVQRETTAPGVEPFTRFNWDGDTYLSEIDAGGTLQAMYCTEPGGYGPLVACYRNFSGTWYRLRYGFDIAGNVTAIRFTATSSGTIRKYYTAFGQQLLFGSALGNTVWFGGRWGYMGDRISNSILYIRRRWYDAPDVQQWVSADPLGVRVGDVNLYAYVRNRPLLDVDPSGQEGVNVNYLPGRGAFSLIVLGPRDISEDWSLYQRIGSNLQLNWVANRNQFIGGDGCCLCTSAGVIQIRRHQAWYSAILPIRTWRWGVDKGIPYPHGDTPVIEPCGNQLSPAIKMRDTPNAASFLFPGSNAWLRALYGEFETCIVCLKGPEGIRVEGTPNYSSGTVTIAYGLASITVYGCVTWSHEIVCTSPLPNTLFCRDVIRNVQGKVANGATGEVIQQNIPGGPPSAVWVEAVSKYLSSNRSYPLP